MKTCTACGEQKPLSDYYLEKGKPRAKCKDCHKATAYKKRLEDRDAFNEERREYTNNNRAKINEAAREYRERHGDRINEQRRQRRAEDPAYRERDAANAKRSRDRYPERVAARNERYYEANRDRLNAEEKARRDANIEAYRARERAYNERNREKRRAYNREYYAKYPEKFDTYRATRRQRLEAVEKEDIKRLEIFERDGGQCRLCGITLTPDTFELDHIVPLKLGGPHIWSNVQVLCGPCNRRKSAKLEGQIHLPV